jgi:hypothetical protein
MNKKTFVLHDESVNSKGFRMLTSGANLTIFRKNPVMLFMHDDYNMPIGKWDNIRIEGTRILADPVFDEKDTRAIGVMDKVNRGFLNMASMGAWAPEEMTDDPVLKLPGQTLPTVTKWTAREASIVTIGSNHNALALYDRETGSRIELNDVALNNFKAIGGVKNYAWELENLTNMTWDQIDKENKLSILKTKYYSLYESKFIERFGKKPLKN